MVADASDLNAAPPRAEPVASAAMHDAHARAETVWRSLTIFCRYRIVVAAILALFYWGMQRQSYFEPANVPIAVTAIGFLFAAAIALALTAQARVPAPALHLTLQVAVDVLAITVLMFAAGGVKSGLGLLLLVSIASSSLVSRGRIAYFHAAMAALAILIEQSWRLLALDAPVAEFVQAGLLAGSFFLIAALSYTLAKYAEGAERVAAARGVDLANLAQINELVIRDMLDGFIVVDEAGRIRQRNAQSERLVGSRRGALNGALADCSPELGRLLDDWRAGRAQAFAPFRDPITQCEVQVRFVRIGVQREPGAASPTVIFVEDAGRIRSQAQQLKLAALGRLTASIAHEIRNPLSSINHAAELLQEDVERQTGREAETRLLTIIRDNAFRLDRMVQEVLYLSRRDRTHAEPIELATYLRTFAADFCGNEKLAATTIAIDVPAALVVHMDRSHLNQILWNLARNAVEHASGGAGCVLVFARPDPGGLRVWLDVTDDGPGVPAEATAHLFEPFFTTRASGTGLGLYIARELADVNGAQLEYVGHGVRPPGGASFRLSLPRTPSA
ncbi:MAG: HAMP domain-containing histidine kinase [Betaproteobacteria bacterium]|nr:HAMP domain-containing histidine kinase [Betaproteobacteria bacterium]